MHSKEEKLAAFGRMLDVLDTLREKCPWDRKQTNESLRPNTIEETYELSDALMKGDSNEIMKELGDVLLHVPEPPCLPEQIMADPRVNERVRIPMVGASRSLNLANAAAIGLYGAWRALGFPGGS